MGDAKEKVDILLNMLRESSKRSIEIQEAVQDDLVLGILRKAFGNSNDSAMKSMVESYSRATATRWKKVIDPLLWFSGSSPTALRIRELICANELLSPGEPKEEYELLKQILAKQFVFPVTTEKEELYKFQTLIAEVLRYFNEAPKNKPPVLTSCHFSGMEIASWPELTKGTGVFNVEVDGIKYRSIVLKGAFAGMKIVLICRLGHTSVMAYWHPGEQTWIVADPGLHFTGATEALDREFRTFLVRSGITREYVDIQDQLKIMARAFREQVLMPEHDAVRERLRESGSTSISLAFGVDDRAVMLSIPLDEIDGCYGNFVSLSSEAQTIDDMSGYCQYDTQRIMSSAWTQFGIALQQLSETPEQIIGVEMTDEDDNPPIVPISGWVHPAPSNYQ